MIKAQTIIIDKKRFAVLPEKEYLTILQDIADLKKVIKRRNEPGTEATLFFKTLADKRKKNKN